MATNVLDQTEITGKDQPRDITEPWRLSQAAWTFCRNLQCSCWSFILQVPAKLSWTVFLNGDQATGQ